MMMTGFADRHQHAKAENEAWDDAQRADEERLVAGEETVMDSTTNRPEWVTCVADNHADFKGRAWCGRLFETGEFRFQDAEHAAQNGRQCGRLVACTECVTALCTALHRGA